MKAVHVLAGSIIEALLIDFLLSTKHKAWSTNKILGLKFNEAIKECRGVNLLSDKTESITTVVKDFRNLIHPGRIKRLEQNVDSNSAQVAISLAEMILDEVREKRQSIYGLTSEQLVTQLERDLNVVKVLEHFTAGMQEIELEKLLLKVIPDRYFEHLNQDPNPYTDETLEALQECFHQVFENVADEVKTKVMRRHLWILRNEGSYKIDLYENVFFKNSYFKYIPNSSDRKFIKDRFFALVSDAGDLGDLSHKFSTIGPYLDDDEIENFSARVLRGFTREDITSFWIWENYSILKQEHQQKFMEALEKQKAYLFSSGEVKTKLKDLKSYLESDAF